MRPEPAASNALVDAAGELGLNLRLKLGRIETVDVGSTRPDLARALLQGRTPAEAQVAVPLLFSICAMSQATACRLACATAAGTPITEAELASARASVAAETVRELSHQALLTWPASLGELTDPSALQAARTARSWQTEWLADRAQQPAREALDQALFGIPASAWLALPSWTTLRAWSLRAHTGPARFLAHHLHRDYPLAGEAATPFLPPPAEPWLRELAAQAQVSADFCRHPVWRGAPAETGSLARLHADALLADPAARPGSRLPLRFVARLRELAGLLCGHSQPKLGALALSPGLGLGWVENARGLLVHIAQQAHGRLASYRIVAPTEWNFHPGGAIASALKGATVLSPRHAVLLAERLASSLDPCVVCRVEVSHA